MSDLGPGPNLDIEGLNSPVSPIGPIISPIVKVKFQFVFGSSESFEVFVVAIIEAVRATTVWAAGAVKTT
jgi:hypothetical protein